MTKERKQSVSRFTEEQLTPLEQNFADAKANRDAGVEPYKIVPIELWEEITEIIEAHAFLSKMEGHKDTHKITSATLEKMKQL